MNEDDIRKLQAGLRQMRTAKGRVFQAWEISKHTVQDDISPRQRRQRLRLMASSKRLCLRIARRCADLEIRILAARMT
jgi:hypothetical protein